MPESGWSCLRAIQRFLCAFSRARSVQQYTPAACEAASTEANDKRNPEQTSCLLVHGFNGEPSEMRELERVLLAQGFAARTLLLPGHGTSVREFAAFGWDDWYCAVHAATCAELERHAQVVLIGHSLGGALMLSVAAHEPRVAGVAALCPPIRLHPLLGRIVARVHRIVRYVPSGFEDLRDRRAVPSYRRHVYRWTPLVAVHSLYSGLAQLREELPDVRCPALIVCARHDHIVPMRDGVEAHCLLGSAAAEKELVVLERSFHQITRDAEREVVFDAVSALCRRVSEAASDT